MDPLYGKLKLGLNFDLDIEAETNQKLMAPINYISLIWHKD